MTGGASREGAQPCLVHSLPGRPAKRIKAAEGDFPLCELTLFIRRSPFDRLRVTK